MKVPLESYWGIVVVSHHVLAKIEIILSFSAILVICGSALWEEIRRKPAAFRHSEISFLEKIPQPPKSSGSACSVSQMVLRLSNVAELFFLVL